MPGQTRSLRPRPVAFFSLSAAIVATACAAIVRSHLFAASPDVAAWGVTFDLTLTIPIIYYMVVVRRGVARALSIAPVFAAGATLAALLLPRGQQQFLHDLRFVAAPLEIVTIALIAGRIRALRRNPRSPSADPADSIAVATAQVFGTTALSRIVASEVAVLWFALSGWNRQPAVPAGATKLTVHERSGWGSVVVCIVVLIAAESIGVHLLVQMWSIRAAWIVTALDVYGLLWLVGDYHALRLRPSFVSDGELRIRHGLRWTATVPLAAISSVTRVASESDWRRRDVLKLALLDEPRYVVQLDGPYTAQGIAGLRKSFNAIAIAPDDEGVLSALRCACAPAEREA